MNTNNNLKNQIRNFINTSLSRSNDNNSNLSLDEMNTLLSKCENINEYEISDKILSEFVKFVDTQKYNISFCCSALFGNCKLPINNCASCSFIIGLTDNKAFNIFWKKMRNGKTTLLKNKGMIPTDPFAFNLSSKATHENINRNMCRYDTKCTNKLCSFVHSQPRNVNTPIQHMLPTQPQQHMSCNFNTPIQYMSPTQPQQHILCNFNTPTQHTLPTQPQPTQIKPCMYQGNCRKPNCPFFHNDRNTDSSMSNFQSRKKFVPDNNTQCRNNVGFGNTNSSGFGTYQPTNTINSFTPNIQFSGNISDFSQQILSNAQKQATEIIVSKVLERVNVNSTSTFGQVPTYNTNTRPVTNTNTNTRPVTNTNTNPNKNKNRNKKKNTCDSNGATNFSMVDVGNERVKLTKKSQKKQDFNMRNHKTRLVEGQVNEAAVINEQVVPVQQAQHE